MVKKTHISSRSSFTTKLGIRIFFSFPEIFEFLGYIKELWTVSANSSMNSLSLNLTVLGITSHLNIQLQARDQTQDMPQSICPINIYLSLCLGCLGQWMGIGIGNKVQLVKSPSARCDGPFLQSQHLGAWGRRNDKFEATWINKLCPKIKKKYPQARNP